MMVPGTQGYVVEFGTSFCEKCKKFFFFMERQDGEQKCSPCMYDSMELAEAAMEFYVTWLQQQLEKRGDIVIDMAKNAAMPQA